MDNFRKWLQTLVFSIVPITFVYTMGNALYRTLNATTSAPEFSQAFIIVVSGATGVAATAFAIALGVKPPDPDGGGNPSILPLGGSNTSTIIRGISTFSLTYSKFSLPSISSETIQLWIGRLFLLAYLIIGVFAGYVWITTDPSLLPEFIQALAATIWGVILASAAKIIGNP